MSRPEHTTSPPANKGTLTRSPKHTDFLLAKPKTAMTANTNPVAANSSVRSVTVVDADTLQVDSTEMHSSAADELRAHFEQCPPWILVKLRDEMRRRKLNEQQWIANSEKMTQYMEQLSKWKQSAAKQLEQEKAQIYDLMTELQQSVAMELQNLREQLHEKEEELKAKDALLLEQEAMIRGKGSKIKRLTQMMANSEVNLLQAGPIALETNDPEEQFMISDWRVRWLDLNMRPEYMVQLLFKPDFPVLACMLDNGIRVQDDFIAALLNMAEARNDTVRLFKFVIAQEVNDTNLDAKETLFRSNTLATKIMTMYTSIYGTPYLAEVLYPFMQEVANSMDSYEIDPNRNDHNEDMDANMKKLSALVQTFVDRVISSKSSMPMQFRRVCAILVEQVSKKFPDDTLSGVKSFIFLRYFCPALMSPPKEFGVEIIKETPRRTLVLVSKLFQNAVNGAELKEPFMLPLNDFVKANGLKIKNFILDISTLNDSEMSSQLRGLPSKIPINDSLLSIVNGLTTVREQLMEKLRVVDAVLPQTITYRVASRLNVVCSLLGPYKKGGINKMTITLSDPRIAEIVQLILDEDLFTVDLVEILCQDKEKDRYIGSVVFILLTKNPKKIRQTDQAFHKG